MTVQRIDRIHERVQLQQVDLEKVQHRLSLFNLNTFERVGRVDFPDGSRIDVPTMNDSDRAAAAQLFANVPVENRVMLDQAAVNLGKAVYDESARRVGGGTGVSTSALNALTSAAQAYSNATGGSAEADQAFMGTAYMGIVGLEGDLAAQAKDLQARNQLADELRADMKEIQNELADWPDDGSTRTFSWTEVKADGTVVKHENEKLTKKEAQALLEDLQGQLDGVKDQTELQKMDLQDKMQKYQEALQCFSEILADANKTMLATINNLKA